MTTATATATKPRRKCVVLKQRTATTPLEREEAYLDTLGDLTGILDAVLEAAKNNRAVPGEMRKRAWQERRRVVMRLAKLLGCKVADLERTA